VFGGYNLAEMNNSYYGYGFFVGVLFSESLALIEDYYIEKPKINFGKSSLSLDRWVLVSVCVIVGVFLNYSSQNLWTIMFFGFKDCLILHNVLYRLMIFIFPKLDLQFREKETTWEYRRYHPIDFILPFLVVIASFGVGIGLIYYIYYNHWLFYQTLMSNSFYLMGFIIVIFFPVSILLASITGYIKKLFLYNPEWYIVNFLK
jgi:hypothetical protein